MKAKHVGIIIWVVIAAAFIFCFWYFGIKNIFADKDTSDEEDIIAGSMAECSHGDDFVEPVLQAGDYYIDGNTDNNVFYIHIGDDETYNVCGDVEKYIDSFATFFDDNLKAESIEQYSKPMRYRVMTYHEAGDRTLIQLEQKTENGIGFSTGPSYISETSFKDGDNIYKLVSESTSSNLDN